jgi:nucleotide-binding universal stress UspA family protein
MGRTMFTQILVPLDGSEYADTALDTAVDVAKKFDGKVTLFPVSLFSFVLPLHMYGGEGS